MLTLPTLPLATPTLLLASIAAAGVLVYLPFLLVAYGRIQVGIEALVAPRAIVDKLPPYAQRATWAHQNAFEAFTLFSAAALIAYVTDQQSALVGWAAVTFVVARSLYPVFYILNVVPGRSLTFAIGSLSIATLMGTTLISQFVH